ncbi:hypothetical protein GPA_12860 [Gordonibacter pamelaeae 7-10-1-b]|uniref:Uncharacterized protein n=1 Tax=Gordonibacter pamelaeae 7-10-1-b TaxID=657308 RepID=D6E885_9ACTN|nr:hypothetical protein GPA_12860 [Gordonibacter pamelaeae 7-10-1-b]
MVLVLDEVVSRDACILWFNRRSRHFDRRRNRKRALHRLVELFRFDDNPRRRFCRLRRNCFLVRAAQQRIQTAS